MEHLLGAMRADQSAGTIIRVIGKDQWKKQRLFILN